jgi:hypothetical protein
MEQTTTADPAAAGPTPPPAPRSSSSWTGGRVVGVVFSSFAALVGAGLLIGGLFLVGAYAFARDDDGYFTTATKHLQRNAYAITTGNVDLGSDPAGPAPSDVLGTVRVTVDGGSSRPVFLGIAPTADLNRYLRGVGQAELTEFYGAPRYDVRAGGAPAAPPGAQGFWVAETRGTGQQRLNWDSRAGNWSVAVMNADAARGVSVDADVGAKLDWLIWVGAGLTVLGLVLLAGGVILIVRIARRAGRETVIPAAS